MKKRIQLETLACPTCVVKIEKAVNSLPGVNSGEVRFNASRVIVDFDENLVGLADIENAISKLGYEVIKR